MRVVLSRKPRNPMEIASLTKMMTFFVVNKIAKSKNLDISN